MTPRKFILLFSTLVAIARTFVMATTVESPQPTAVNTRSFCTTGIVTHILHSPDSSLLELSVEGQKQASVIIVLGEHATKPPVVGDVFAFDVEPHFRFPLLFQTAGPIRKIEHRSAPRPRVVNPEALPSGFYDWRLCEISGSVLDVVRSELSSDWIFILVQDGETILYLGLPDCPTDSDMPRHLVGARISATCVCMLRDGSYRHRIGRSFHCAGRHAIRILEAAPTDPYSVPDITSVNDLSPALLARHGRLRASGRVVASGLGNRAYIQSTANEIISIEPADGNLPSYGDSIDSVGLPETDLQHINLSRAIWRLNNEKTSAVPPTTDLASVWDIPNTGAPTVRPHLHGKRVLLTGTILAQTRQGEPNCAFLHVDSNSHLVSICVADHASGLEFVLGSTVRVTGTYILDIENWRPTQVFPQVRGFTIVVNDPNDIILVSSPSWWTPKRAWFVLGSLLALLVVILIWNASLRILAERRGRELLRGQIKSIESELKVEERTRLAVELHDSLSQYLTGVAMEICAANKLVDHDLSQAHRHLDIAAQALRSSHAELRNCLRDLRTRLLELPTLNEAIRQTLLPRMGNVELLIRFNVRRERLTDNTTHNILHITRELATNAVHHGQASKIKIAGCLDDNRILFSVEDNGHGFDPNRRLGPESGHFGLQGVQERVETFNGSMKIESGANGTKITIVLATPLKKQK